MENYGGDRGGVQLSHDENDQISNLNPNEKRNSRDREGEEGRASMGARASMSQNHKLGEGTFNINLNGNKTMGGVSGGVLQTINEPKLSHNVIDLVDSNDDDDEVEIMERMRSKNSMPAAMAAADRSNHMPLWMTQQRSQPAISGGENMGIQKSFVVTPTGGLYDGGTVGALQSMYHPIAPTSSAQSLVPYPSSTIAASASLLPTPTTSQPPPVVIQEGTAIYEDQTPGFVPHWKFLIPATNNVLTRMPSSSYSSSAYGEKHFYKLSLLSVTTFTVTAIHPSGSPIVDPLSPSAQSLVGLRIHIKKIARHCNGKAVFERDWSGGSNNNHLSGVGRWRIPLGAYHNFLTYLTSDARNVVMGIPDEQLRIASMGKAFMDKSYPSVDDLVHKFGVPRGLANALAPYQRGGVDFVHHRHGCALIADEMGLGKSIQAIAAMTRYESEWPLLVVCPSSARYHWESEFRQWLGSGSSIHRKNLTNPKSLFAESSSSESEDCNSQQHKHTVIENQDSTHSPDNGTTGSKLDDPPTMKLLTAEQILVLTNSKQPICKNRTRVLISSYDLLMKLADTHRIDPGDYRCVIVDESHMLKSTKTKRTRLILPILNGALRCVMLSGTPAFARPMELWPQLSVLGRSNGWWGDPNEFSRKYSAATEKKRSAQSSFSLLSKSLGSENNPGPNDDDEDKEESSRSSNALAELHTLLTSTVMIRRMKADILKTLPRKIREAVSFTIENDRTLQTLREYMVALRKGNGIMGHFARKQITKPEIRGKDDVEDKKVPKNGPIKKKRTRKKKTDQTKTTTLAKKRKRNEKMIGIIDSDSSDINNDSHDENYDSAMDDDSDDENYDFDTSSDDASDEFDEPEQEQNQSWTRRDLLSKLYQLTGQAKVNAIVKTLNAWIDDPTKGKLCIFAHHKSVLDNIEFKARLSPRGGPRSFIRIDGTTPPRKRRECIDSFQNDPTLRIALLGITAAGVAVTLTASSTVWFAELYWTPALLVQAEDRCHRIGQQANVKCLYFIAKETIDEVLWSLIEKKFRDLGQFVEGKEKLGIVIDKKHDEFDSEGKLKSEREEENDAGENDDEEKAENGDKPNGGPLANKKEVEDLANNNEIRRDIQALAMEGVQSMMMKKSDDDDEEEPCIAIDTSSYRLDKEGGSEKSAICLVDDGGDSDGAASDNGNENIKPTQTVATFPPSIGTPKLFNQVDAVTAFRNADRMSKRVNPTIVMPPMRIFGSYFLGPTAYGLTLLPYQGRFIIKKLHPDRIKKVGDKSKPRIGDILIAIGNYQIPLFKKFDSVIDTMKKALKRPPVKLLFAECEAFRQYFNTDYQLRESGKGIDEGGKKKGNRPKEKNSGIGDIQDDTPNISENDAVIELLDD